MNYKIYKLYFPKGIKAESTGGLSIYADQLFSAIINEASNINRAKVQEITKIFQERKLILSDAFPFLGEEIFLPKPMLSVQGDNADSSEKKKYKKIDYVPLTMWGEYIKGQSDPTKILDLLEKIYVKNVQNKIKHNEDGNHDIYSVEYFNFKKDAGLYFILGYEEAKELFDEILIGLSFTGLGGRKSTGIGRFKFEEVEIEKLSNKISNERGQMILSTSMPAEDEKIFDKENSFKLIRRGGFIYSEDEQGSQEKTVRKKTQYYFKAGSIINKNYKGDIFRVDKNFKHPVYRYSVPIWMEIK